MANILIKFRDVGLDNDFITAQFLKSSHDGDVIYLKIESENCGTTSEIFLDKSTAIKFAKTLRTEINKIS